MRLGFENVAVMSIAHAEAPIRLESSQIEDRLENTFKRIGCYAGVRRVRMAVSISSN